MLQIQLLGDFQLLYKDQAIPAFQSSRLQSLLAYLLIHADTPQSRQQIAYHFWPVSGDSQARTNLRKLFLQLRRALPDSDTFITFDNQSIQWQVDSPCTADITEIQFLLGALRENPLDQDILTQIAALYQSQLLPSCYDDWIVPIRERLHQEVVAALDRLVTLLENQRSYEEAIRYAQRLLSFEPLAEKSHQQLMRLHSLNGNRAKALESYRTCKEVLAEELGVDPSAETQALYERLLESAESPDTGKPNPQPALNAIPLIGRQPEWQTLKEAWRSAVRGCSGLVTISGEAGIGKTRLAEELYMWASQQGIAIARARSYQAQGALAYAPVAELLRTEHIRHQLHRLGEARLTHIARLLPSLLDEYPTLDAPQPMTESWQQHQFFSALVHAVRGDGQPLLLLIDDLQWCDGETLAWLQHLLQSNKSSPLLIIGTIRTGEAESDHPLHGLLHGLRRDDLLTEIRLLPLNAAEVGALAKSLQDEAMAAEALRQLYADTEGNPLFVVESVRAQQDSEQQVENDSNESGLPPKIYAVIRSRLTQLAPETQTLANLAAAIGRSFSYDVLMEASSMTEEEVVDSLEELLTRQIIREQGVDAYDFSHDRIRDVAYGEVSRTRRRLLHRRVAEALEKLNSHNLSRVSGLLAEQYGQANNAKKAVDYLTIASQHAVSQFNHQDALDYLGRALQLVERNDYKTCYRLLDERLTLHYFRGDIQLWLEDLNSFEGLIEAWPKSDTSLQKREAKLALYWLQYHHARSKWNKAISYGEQAILLAHRCGESTVEARALFGCGSAYWALSDFDRAKEYFEQALDKARSAGLNAIAAESLEHLMASYMFSGGGPDRIAAALDECMAIYQKAGDQKGIAGIYNKYGYLPMAQGVGEYEQAQRDYARGLAIYQQIGFTIGEATVWRNLAVLYTCSGDYREAERCAKSALFIEEKKNRVEMAAVVRNYLGFSYFNQGRLTEAKEIQLRALETFRATTHNHFGVKTITALGWIHFYQNEFDAAHHYLAEALVECRNIYEVRQEGYTLTCLGHLLTEQERLPEARDVYQQALDAHQRMGQFNRAMEPKAGLAYVDHLERNPNAAICQVNEILAHLENHTLDRTEEGFYAYLLCWRILQARQDPRADALLQVMHDQLETRAATIDDPEHQRMFWEEIPSHREVREAMTTFVH